MNRVSYTFEDTVNHANLQAVALNYDSQCLTPCDHFIYRKSFDDEHYQLIVEKGEFILGYNGVWFNKYRYNT